MDTATEQTFRDGDIFRWRWRDGERDADRAPFRAYHCKSMMAIQKGKDLYDTYWCSPSYEHRLRPEDVMLTHLGNQHDMTEIHISKKVYYRSEDLVDMRHSNNPRGPVYLKAGAVKNADVMRQEVEQRIEAARREIASAQHQIERMNEALTLIDAGDLSAVYL